MNETTHFLGREELKKLVPAAFSRNCDPKVTSRYKFVSTMSVLDRLEDRGMRPVVARQNFTEHRQWAFHEIRLAPKTAQLVKGVDDPIRRQVILTNSHDRTRRLTIMAGFFRLICTNGLIAPMKNQEGESLGYSGRSLHLKSLNPDHMIDEALKALDRGGVLIKKMAHCKMSTHDQTAFVSDVFEHIYGEKHGKRMVKAGLHVRWLTPRREEDAGNDLWRVFNRVQENVVKGGVQLPSGRFTHPLGNAPRTGALTQVRFNEFAWTRALQFLN